MTAPTLTRTTDIGAHYERLARLTLQTHEYWGAIAREVLAWRDFAAKHGLDPRDQGVDLVLTTHDDRHYAVQVKYRASDAKLDRGELATFITSRALFGALEVAGLILITNASLTQSAEALCNSERVVILDFADEGALESSPQVHSPPTLRPYQSEAVERILAAFGQGTPRGKLIMPPGTGKTLVALRVAERYARVLFLAPSIALVDQSLRAWLRDATQPMSVFAVVSDASVGKTADDDLNALSLLTIPATTDAQALVEGVARAPVGRRVVVFATYQSIEVIASAQKHYGLADFDLIVFDEAHRTAVARRGESVFSLAHHDENVRARHRLYMTATPRLWEVERRGGERSPAQTDAELDDLVVYSMDDKAVYGETLYSYSFSRAVQDGYLSDYRVVVFAMSEDTLTLLSAHLGEERAMDSLQSLKAIGLMNILRGKVKEWDDQPAEISIRRGIVFHRNIAESKRFAEHLDRLIAEAEANKVLGKSELKTAVKHIDGTASMHERKQKLDWLREGDEGEHRLLTNAKLLTEGIDVPALDAVVFFNPRDSVVDVVQAVGRVMRRSPGKRYGYVVIPVVVKGDDALGELEKSSYRAVLQVLSALRSVDDAFAARLRLQLVAALDGKGNGVAPTRPDETRQLPLIYDIGDPDLRKRLVVDLSGKLVQRLGLGQRYLESWAQDVAGVAERLRLQIKGQLRRDANTRAQMDKLLRALREFLHETVGEDDAVALLVQHALTHPIFSALFAKLAQQRRDDVTQALDELLGTFSAFLARETESLSAFYEEMRVRAIGLKDEAERAEFLRRLYDAFFREAFAGLADEMGIAYTPVELVDYLVRSADALTQKHFGKRLGDDGVFVLEPFAGTGTFLVRLLHHIAESQGAEALKEKYRRGEIWGNEVLLLPYYIMRANVESAYLALTGEYAPFEGGAFADTFQMAERAYEQRGFGMLSLFPETYTAKLSRQIETPVNVVLTNPPWRAGAEREGAERKNALYPRLRERVTETYAARQQGQSRNLNSLYDQYVQAIRMASDRLGEEGVIGFVVNNGWLSSLSASGLRACLAEEFAEVYVYDLRGDARTRGQDRKAEGGNPFGQSSRAGVCLLLLVKRPGHQGHATIRRYTVGDGLSREAKLDLVRQHRDVDGTPWVEVGYEDWVGRTSERFNALVPLSEAFGLSTFGVKSNRDAYAFNPSREDLERHMRRLIETYNVHVERVNKGEITRQNIDQVVETDESLIKWDRDLKNRLLLGKAGAFEDSGQVCRAYYRPFVSLYGYVSKLFMSQIYQTLAIHPTPDAPNLTLCVTAKGDASPFTALMTRRIADLGLLGKAYLYPLYTYASPSEPVQGELFSSGNGHVRQLNLKPEFLAALAARVGAQPTPEQVFAYIYAVLNHPLYREAFQDDLRQSEPRVPLPPDAGTFHILADAGERLIALHADYEQQPSWNWGAGAPEDEFIRYPHRAVSGMALLARAGVDEASLFRVSEMKLDKARGVLRYNEHVQVVGIPPEVFAWDISGKHALYDVVKYYGRVEQKVAPGKGDGIVWDPNKMLAEKGDWRYIVDLVAKIAFVSITTQEIHQGIEPKLREMLMHRPLA